MSTVFTKKALISLRLKNENVEFIRSISSNLKISHSSLVDEALDNYRKYVLRKELREGFSEQDDQDIKDSMSDFQDYLSIIDNA